MENSHEFDDILNFPHHVSSVYPRMTMLNRAAQFAPFRALTGYEAAIHETGRLTSVRIELDEDAMAELSDRLQLIQDNLEHSPEVAITYFQPDKRKSGGEYLTVVGKVKKIDEFSRSLTLWSGMVIPLDDIFEIGGQIFDAISGA